MNIDISWDIVGMESCPETGTVRRVWYTVTASNSGVVETIEAYEDLPEPGEDMLPFAELTRELVTGWLKDVVGAENVELIECNQRCLVENVVVPEPVSTELPPLF